jgi:DNA-binding NarL/FixJ family response regulator
MSEPLSRVLLADDTAQLRLQLRKVLTRSGRFEVVAEAGNGQEALEAARTSHPDVVLLDLSMPVMDGLQALPLLRQLMPDAVIVVFSGFDDESVEQIVRDRGANAYMEKGQPLRQLIALIDELVAASRLSAANHVAPGSA